MNGYRNPSAFMHVLNYVKDKQYLHTGLAEYVCQQDESIYTLQPHPQFKDMTDFSQSKGPLAIIFEHRSCADCDEFHKEVLMHKDIMKELQGFTLVRLDALSTEPLIDINGILSTAQGRANELQLDYRPGTVLFDDGVEITRAEGSLYHFHYQEFLRYVSAGFYLKYLAMRQKQLL